MKASRGPQWAIAEMEVENNQNDFISLMCKEEVISFDSCLDCIATLALEGSL